MPGTSSNGSRLWVRGGAGGSKIPAEDVFVRLIRTPHGDFRVLEGTWEGATFCLQRVVNAVEEFPPSTRLGAYKESVYTLLGLSDAVCQRAGLARYELGNENRESELPDRFANTIDRLHERVVFSRAELEKLGIDIGAVAEFVFDPAQRDKLGGETLGNTGLERAPVVAKGAQIAVVLPTAISAAIRRATIEIVEALGVRDRLSIPSFGGWSDAIRWDAMEPTLKIRPLGDVHAVIADFEALIGNYAKAGSDLRLNEAIENYGRHLQEAPINLTVDGMFEPEFLSACAEEFGAPFDDLRRFIDCIEDMGIKANQAIVRFPKSQFSELIHETKELGPEVAGPLVESLIFRPRANWRDVPPGYDARDRHPWRFRRRLSVLRKPLIQIDEKDDPTILVAPGMLRDALAFMLSGYHRGDFPRWQLKKEMRGWSGRSSDRRGHEFTQEVAARLGELGWKVESEVAITKLLGMGFDRDYGDVDVLAWRRESGRILVIECKHLQYRKTYGEISEQLADFRGELRADGKPDYLRRHFDRVDLISQHMDRLRAYIGLKDAARVESHLVFKYPVPMQFALERLKQRVSVHLFGELPDL